MHILKGKRMKKTILFFAATLFICIASKAQIDASLFSKKSSFSTGANSASQPHTLSCGDIDGDGKEDIVVPNSGGNTISVFRNICISGHTFDSTGFASKIDLTVLTTPMMTAVTDVDNDGKQDIVVAHYNSNTLSVFPGSSTVGVISFATRIDVSASTNPGYLIFADLDGDGKKDMIVSNFGAGTISVFKNTSTSGTISFSVRVDYNAGNGAALLSAVDLNKDGKKDIIVTNYNGNSFSVFKNNSTVGSLSFSTAKNITSNGLPNGLDVYDINKDSLPDLAITNSSYGQISIFQNVSTIDSIKFALKFIQPTGSTPQSLLFCDLDNNGIKDLCIVNRLSDSMTVFHIKNGLTTVDSNFYDTKTTFSIPGGPLALVAADMDNNGSLDLTVTNYATGKITVLTNKLHTTGTGINEQIFHTKNVLNVFPNPFGSSINIPLGLNEILESVIFYDVCGKLLFTSKENVIDTKNLSNGTYFIDVKTDKNLYHQKVIKQD